MLRRKRIKTGSNPSISCIARSTTFCLPRELSFFEYIIIKFKCLTLQRYTELALMTIVSKALICNPVDIKHNINENMQKKLRKVSFNNRFAQLCLSVSTPLPSATAQSVQHVKLYPRTALPQQKRPQKIDNLLYFLNQTQYYLFFAVN